MDETVWHCRSYMVGVRRCATYRVIGPLLTHHRFQGGSTIFGYLSHLYFFISLFLLYYLLTL